MDKTQKTQKILINTSSFQLDNNVVELCQCQDVKIELNPYKRKLTKPELLELADDSVIGMLAGTEKIDDEVMQQTPNLRVISRCGVASDNVDLKAAAERNISIYTTPDGPTQAVAELTLGLMLDSLRYITNTDHLLKSGKWVKQMGSLLSGKCVGLVGFGRIAKKLLSLLKPFDATILVYDPFVALDQEDVKQCDYEYLLKNSNIISFHLPLSKHTYHMLGSKQFELLKQDVLIINTSRGGIIDEQALLTFLSNTTSARAALDVFEQEPYSGDLRQCQNILLTSHIGSYAKECRAAMEQESMSNLLKGLGIDMPVNKEIA